MSANIGIVLNKDYKLVFAVEGLKLRLTQSNGVESATREYNAQRAATLTWQLKRERDGTIATYVQFGQETALRAQHANTISTTGKPVLTLRTTNTGLKALLSDREETDDINYADGEPIVINMDASSMPLGVGLSLTKLSWK